MRSEKIKELRNLKGYSQERLADESGLSLRTIQRVEKGETDPRGDTIQRLAKVLDVATDDLLENGQKKDTTSLVLLNLSPLSFLVFPFLGIILPSILWAAKKERVRQVKGMGKQILNFQITWTLALLGVVFMFFIWDRSWLSFLIDSPLSFLNQIHIRFTFLIIVLSLYNLILITLNSVWVGQGKELWYYPRINFIDTQKTVTEYIRKMYFNTRHQTE